MGYTHLRLILALTVIGLGMPTYAKAQPVDVGTRFVPGG